MKINRRLPPTEFRKCRRAILFEAKLALILIVVLICARELFQKYTTLGEQLDAAAYNWIQLRLASHSDGGNIPIAIADISELETAAIPGARKNEKATPRDRLGQVIDVLAKKNPLAIGVDIDFAPINGTYVTPDDPNFFKELLRIYRDTGVPIYLGINRTQALPRSQWLLEPEYELLAASILAPLKDTRKMLKCFQLNQQSECGPTMSEALAQQLPPPPVSRFLEAFPWLFTRILPQSLSNSISVGTFPVDYSPLEELMNDNKGSLQGENNTKAASAHTINAANLAVLQTEEESLEIIRNRVVLIGDASTNVAVDQFYAPGRPDERVAGVYLHACAVYTLAKAPLYDLTLAGRCALDFLFGGSVVLVLMLIRLHFARTTVKVVPNWCEGVLILVVVFIAFGISAGFVHRSRVLWSDFPLVVFSLVLHPSLQRYLPLSEVRK